MLHCFPLRIKLCFILNKKTEAILVNEACLKSVEAMLLFEHKLNPKGSHKRYTTNYEWHYKNLGACLECSVIKG